MTATAGSIAVCDTEPISIEGMRATLAGCGDLHLVAADSRLPEAGETVRTRAPAVLVVDRAFGGHAVTDFIRSLRVDFGTTRVVVWGFGIGQAEAVRYLQAGARGVILKTSPLAVVLECLRTVAAGGTWMESLPKPERVHLRPGRSCLTAREAQVLALVERGLRNRDIGAALGIRTGTVKIHLKHIFEKTGVHGRYRLAISAITDKGAGDGPPASDHGREGMSAGADVILNC
jgi:DNA-binding NarL/FixJ family response regulator